MLEIAVGATYGAIAPPTSGLLVEGNVGIGTTSPGSILALGGTAARIFGMDRNTTAATGGRRFRHIFWWSDSGNSGLGGRRFNT